MVKKTGFFLFFFILLTPLSAQEKKLVILKSQNLKPINDAVIAFKTACTAQYREYTLEGEGIDTKTILKEIGEWKPDLVFAVGPQGAEFAKQNLSPTPIVFALVLDPDSRDLKSPNVTGVRMEVPLPVQMEALKAIVPRVKKVGVLYNPKRSEALIQQAKEIGKSLDIEILASRVERKEDAVFALELFAGGVDLFWLIPDATVANKEVFEKLLEFTTKNRIPFFAFSEQFVKAKALFSLSASYDGMGSQACEIANRILQGKSPKEIPWESPKNLILSLNIQTAQQMGFTEIATNVFGYAAKKAYKIQPIQ